MGCYVANTKSVGAAEGCESNMSEAPPFAAFGSSYKSLNTLEQYGPV
jgi:hypothetical protein